MNCYKRFTDGRSNTWTVRHTRKGLEQHLSSFLVSLEPKKKFELNTYYEIRTTLSTIFFMKNYWPTYVDKFLHCFSKAIEAHTNCIKDILIPKCKVRFTRKIIIYLKFRLLCVSFCISYFSPSVKITMWTLVSSTLNIYHIEKHNKLAWHIESISKILQPKCPCLIWNRDLTNNELNRDKWENSASIICSFGRRLAIKLHK